VAIRRDLLLPTTAASPTSPPPWLPRRL